jgi:hypothetical protein
MESMDKNLALTFASINSEKGMIEGVAQMGIRFAYSDEQDKTPLEFFVYTTDSKVQDLFSSSIEAQEISDTLTIYFGMSANEIIFSIYKGEGLNTDNIIEELKLSEYSDKDISMPDEMQFAKTAKLQRPIVNLCLNETVLDDPQNIFNIKILDFEYIAPSKEFTLN